MDEISEPSRSSDDRADIAKQVNAHILEMAEGLDSILKDERPIGFFCECGCLGFVESTPADFRAREGAWIEGHR
jgi:hypothetical protein